MTARVYLVDFGHIKREIRMVEGYFGHCFFTKEAQIICPLIMPPKIRPFPRVSLPRGCKNAFHVCACPAMIPGASTLHCRAKGFFYTENM